MAIAGLMVMATDMDIIILMAMDTAQAIEQVIAVDQAMATATAGNRFT